MPIKLNQCFIQRWVIELYSLPVTFLIYTSTSPQAIFLKSHFWLIHFLIYSSSQNFSKYENQKFNQVSSILSFWYWDRLYIHSIAHIWHTFTCIFSSIILRMKFSMTMNIKFSLVSLLLAWHGKDMWSLTIVYKSKRPCFPWMLKLKTI